MLVHHGLFWNFHPTGLTPLLAERLRPLFKHDINLAAYHLPLDAHPELGNNAILARALGCENRAAVRASTRARRSAAAAASRRRRRRRTNFARASRAATGREPLLLGGGPERIRSIGIVSGSAADTLARGRRGRPGRVPHRRAARAHHRRRRGAGHDFVAAGHYATETFGVRALGDLLAERFGIEHIFVELANPV